MASGHYPDMSSQEIIEAVGSEVESDQIDREIYGNE
jgi:hypothetical protein